MKETPQRPQPIAAPFFTIQEVAEYVRVDSSTVRRWAQAQLVEAIMLPSPRRKCTWRVTHTALETLGVTYTSPSDLLTVAEVASALRVDHSTVRRWIRSGAMEAIDLPRQNERRCYRIRQTTLACLLAGKGKEEGANDEASNECTKK